MANITLLDLVSMAIPVMEVAHGELLELDPEAAARIETWLSEARMAERRARGFTEASKPTVASGPA